MMFTRKYRRHRNWHYVSTRTTSRSSSSSGSLPPFSAEYRVAINERDTRRTIRAIALEPKIVFPLAIIYPTVVSLEVVQYFYHRLRHISGLIKNKHVGPLFSSRLFPMFPYFHTSNALKAIYICIYTHTHPWSFQNFFYDVSYNTIIKFAFCDFNVNRNLFHLSRKIFT